MRPLRTSKGSLNISRSRSNTRLIAGWLKKFRFAAAVTFRSSNRARRWTNRFRSRLCKCTVRIPDILTMHGTNCTSGALISEQRYTGCPKERRGTKFMARAAIITGASRGIGAAVAERLAKDGFSVVVNYAGSEAEATALVNEIKSAGGRAIPAKADVSKADEVSRMFEVAETEFEGVDVLVNNAGIMLQSSIG